MNCPNCGAPMRLDASADSFACDYCRTVYLPEKNDDGIRDLNLPAGLDCPVCSAPLVHASLEGRRLFYCRQCHGMLIHMDVFVSLIDELRGRSAAHPVVQRPPDPHSLERRLTCPGCHNAMDTHFYGGPGNIVIDDCSRCSWNWLDYGELPKITSAPGRSYPSPEDSGSYSY